MPEPQNLAGGTILGIHNLAIVFPQFIVSGSVSVVLSTSDICCCRSPLCRAPSSTLSMQILTMILLTTLPTTARMVWPGSCVSEDYVHWYAADHHLHTCNIYALFSVVQRLHAWFLRLVPRRRCAGGSQS